MPIRTFELPEIMKAIKNLQAPVLGKGGFGIVYEGNFEPGVIDKNKTTPVAVKLLKPGSEQGRLEFATEVATLSEFKHPHIVSLLGYCDEVYNHDRNLIIVYELMQGGTVAKRVLNKTTGGSGPPPEPLSWVQRLNICIGAADGLNYIHSKGTDHGSRYIHRDIKSSNILLNEKLEAKVADFGLAKLTPPDRSYYVGQKYIKGTVGYLDPAYMETKKLTRRSDVYSFGVVMLEILCGRYAADTDLPRNQQLLTKWAKPIIQTVTENEIRKIIDDRIVNEIQWGSLEEYVKIVNQCLDHDPNKRPSMLEVLDRLRNALLLQQAIN
ncbi:hypothetical protein LguiA_001447 [Lonicera macranthoides]